jgi:hypothetical protein
LGKGVNPVQKSMEEIPMKAYEVYELNPETGEEEMIGILPERRRDLSRTTKESVLNWGKILLGDKAGSVHIYFIEVSLQKTNEGVFWPFSEEVIKNNSCQN